MFLRTFQSQAFLERKSLGKPTKVLMIWKKVVGVVDSVWDWEIGIEICCQTMPE